MVRINDSLLNKMRRIRRDIHQYPELNYQEFRTASLIKRELDRLDITWSDGLAITGIRAEINGKSQHSRRQPVIALRTDMDALPLEEDTGHAYSSKNPGVMHACGHDGHVAMLLGAAELLRAGQFPGTVVLLFQPAEEAGNGAEQMIRDGALNGVDMVFGGHLDTHYPTGWVTVDEGMICSFCDAFSLRIVGRGGHASKPHEAVDCVVIAASLVTSIQQLVSRFIDPRFPGVVTVGRMISGTARNVIADQALLEGTIRSGSQEIRTVIIRGLQQMVDGLATMYGATIELEFQEHLPAVINDPLAADLARRAALSITGEAQVIEQRVPSLGGEDFAFYQQQIPGCMVRFGAQPPDREVGPAHSPQFDFDEQALGWGSAWLARVAVQALEHLSGQDSKNDNA
ncbi:MAG: peptidase M20 [Desulfobulbus propionicus]|nr:MAG: peptidase M20 [Desulfobulbus propionicus]